MKKEVGTQKAKPLWSIRWDLIGIGLFMALFSAAVNTNDTYVGKNILAHPDMTISILTYLFLGSWIGVLANLIFNRILGRKLSPSFKRETFVSANFQLLMVLIGFLSASATAGSIYVAVTEGDPWLLIVLSNIYIITLAIADGISNRKRLVGNTVVSLILILGVLLSSVDDRGEKITISLTAVLIMLAGQGIANALSRILEKRATKNDKTEIVNINFWRFLWLAVFLTILVFVYAGRMDQTAILLDYIQSIWLKAFPWIGLTMIFAYGANLLRIKITKEEDPFYSSAFEAAKVPLGYILTLIFFMVRPDVFNLPTLAQTWVIRVIGAALVTGGIYYLEVKKAGRKV